MTSIISIMADDGHKAHKTYLEPILTAHGLKCSLYVPIDKVGYKNRMTTNDLLGLQTIGWDVCSHGWGAGDYTQLDTTELASRLTLSFNWLVANGFTNGSKHFGPPADKWNDTLTPYATAVGYKTVRAQNGTLLPTGYNLVLRGCAQSKAWSVIQGYIDDAVATDGTYLCLVFHGIVQDACTTTKLECNITRVTDTVHAVLASGLTTGTIHELYTGVIP